ncbi:hypothetical protein ACP193_05500 [Spiroplasma endosymbiont of Glossina fuscipes fuscipes]
MLNIKQYRQLDHKGKIAMILAIVVGIFNIIFSILYYVLRNVWSKILNYTDCGWVLFHRLSLF